MDEGMETGGKEVGNGMSLRLVRKGRGQPLAGLAQQGNIHLELARKYAETFTADGSWTREETDNYARMVLVLQSDASQRLENRLEARQATRTEHQAITESKRFIRRLRNALPRVMQEGTAHGVTRESFAAGKPLRRSTPQISNYLNQIVPALTRLDGDLKRHFRNQNPSALALALKNALDQADTQQEVKLANLPLETLQFYETKGRVVELMEHLIRAARNTFADEPQLAAQFNKRVLERARAAARATGDGANGDAGDGDTPPPAQDDTRSMAG